MLTREILSIAEHEFEQEADYIAGLLHNLGILILAITFPEHFSFVYKKKFSSQMELIELENESVGWNHAKIGAYYLWNHHISEEVVNAIHWHNQPDRAESRPELASAIQLADHFVRQLEVTGMEEFPLPEPGSYKQLEGWKILFGEDEEIEEMETRLEGAVERLSKTLRGIL